MTTFLTFLLIFLGGTFGEIADDNDNALYYEASNYGMTWIEAAQVYLVFYFLN